MNNVWSTLLGLVAELKINKKSKKEVTALREESDGDKFGHLPFTWKNQKFRLERQMVRAITFRKLQKIWAVIWGEAIFLLLFSQFCWYGNNLQRGVLPPRQILKFNACAEDFQPRGLCKCRLSQSPSLLISGCGSWPPLARLCRRKHKKSTVCASRSWKNYRDRFVGKSSVNGKHP